MSDKKRILILTADAGFGHRSAANAIAAALEQLYPGQIEAPIVNPLDDPRTPFFLRDSQSDYDRIVRELPELYRLGYDASDADIPGTIIERTVALFLLEVIADLLRNHQPDAVITTYPLYQSALKSSMITQHYNAPLLTAVTDLVTVHRLWFHRRADACLVPTPEVRELALGFGLPESGVHITGIPVHPDVVNETRSKSELRRTLGWHPDLPTFLVVGSRRIENLLEALQVLNHFGRPLQLAVVAGKDEELYAQLQQIE